MKHKTVVNKIDLPEKPRHMLLLYPILLVLGKHSLYTIVENQIQKIQFTQDLLGVAHLPTYFNKVILWSQSHIKVVNILTHKIVVEIESPLKIRCIRVTPALDVIAIGSDDKVGLFDIQ